jgi:hypothetical protein
MQTEETTGAEVFRLELLKAIISQVDWHLSDTVISRPGNSRQVLRLIKRYHRIEGIIKRAAAPKKDLTPNVPPAIVPKSPYDATYGARLTINGRTWEHVTPYGEKPTLSEIEQLRKPPASQPPKAPAAARATVPRARARARV